jgi:NDP-sugar pyrophosphorylase family protein
LILSGDSYVAWNLQPMLDLAEARRADLVMALQSVPDVGRSGNVVLGEDERVIGFVEKGTNTGVGLINAGVYLLRGRNR